MYIKTIIFLTTIVIFLACANKKTEEDIPDPVTVTDVDGYSYKVVKIGNHYWMAENLRTTKYNDGSPIPKMTDSLDWANNANTKSPAYCWYKNDSVNYGLTYGALYNWYTVKSGKLAPKGWHVASDKEWDDLFGIFPNAAGQLKESGTAHWVSPNVGATDSLNNGFNALPGGARAFNFNDNGDGGMTFELLGVRGFWWRTDVAYYDSTQGSVLEMENTKYYATKSGGGRSIGMSVRCIKD